MAEIAKPQDDAPVARARSLLTAGAVTPTEALSLAKELMKAREFSWAAELLRRAAGHPTADAHAKRTLGVKRAVCTYKDERLPTLTRLDRAMEILAESDPPATTGDPETLGVAGAIEKRRWEATASVDALETSLEYYRRGASLSRGRDDGYTAINAAFVLDLLAARDAATAARSGLPERESARARRREADDIRRGVVESLAGRETDDDWWVLVTLAEAHFGLGEFAKAKACVDRARALPGVARWQMESTLKQFASLATAQRGDGEGSFRALGAMFDGDPETVRAALLGKVGLALSGGGFRASFFHLGVLARLAELDLLRHVEVLSCVSGGAIVGAYYYLALRKLLESKADEAITRDDYVALVARMAEEFYEGVSNNVRMTAFASTKLQARMALGMEANVTEHVATLYEQHLFRRVDGVARHPLRSLGVRPKDADADFDPRYDNWRRRHRVPTLVLNATTLNTGHNWQFTAGSMGEPAGSIDPEIDASEHLRPVDHGEVPKGVRDVTLGEAVAASACVPGVLDPLEVRGLYPERTVFLVDGGVYDNQGVSSLLEQDVNVLLVSDASGPLEDGSTAPASPLAVPLRSSGILQARVRSAQFRDLMTRRRSLLLRGLMFVHLKKGLDVVRVGPSLDDEPGAEAPDDGSPVTAYGVRKDVQRALAGVRTDLDAFSEAEAFALMTSGYRMTVAEAPGSLGNFPASDAPPHPWPFLRIEPVMSWSTAKPAGFDAFMEHLDIASSGFFKVWRQSLALKLTARFAAVVVVALVALYCASHWDVAVVSFRPTVGRLAMIVLTPFVVVMLRAIFQGRLPQGTRSGSLSRAGTRMALGVLGALSARLFKLFDPIYLSYGRVDRFVPPDDAPRKET